MINLSDIINQFPQYITSVSGRSEGIELDSFSSLNSSDCNSLIWISDRYTNIEEILENTPFAAAICPPHTEYTNILKGQNKTLLHTDLPRLLAIKVDSYFFGSNQPTTIHKTAIISPDAVIGNNCTIEPYVIIGKCIIEDNVYIGAHSILYDNIRVGASSKIKAGSILGTDQSANERDLDGTILTFPHHGGIKIGRNVTIGSNCVIGKGIFDDTIIGDGSVIDSKSIVSHNAIIGRNVFISSACTIGGSATIEDDAILFSNVKTRQWIKIGENAVIGQGSLVISDIPSKELWYGFPAKFRRTVDSSYRPFK